MRFFCNFSTIWAGWTQSRIIGRSPASMIMKKASILCYSLNNNIFSSYIHYYLSGTINTNKYNNNSKHTEDVYDLNIYVCHTPHFQVGFSQWRKFLKNASKFALFFGKERKNPNNSNEKTSNFFSSLCKTSTIAKEIVHREGALELTYIYYTRSWWSSPKVPL